MIKEQMEQIYKNTPHDRIPWNLPSIPEILTDLIEGEKVKPGRALELGCGLGRNVLYLAEKGFEAHGIDVSETAIAEARKSAEQQRVTCNFLAADVRGGMDDMRGQFDFIFDYELLHHIFPADRLKYIENVHRFLKSNGQYLSVCFSEDSPQFGGIGKYRKTPINTELYFSSEEEIEELFSQFFKIKELKTIEVVGKFAPHKAIYALLCKK